MDIRQAVIQDDGIISVRFKIKDQQTWHDILHIIKGLTNKPFDRKRKLWYIVYTEDNVRALKEAGFKIFGEKEDIPVSEKERPWDCITINKDAFPYLHPFQLEGLQFLEFRSRGLITDDMGLGKTVQACSYLKMHPDRRPVLVVCPASVKLQWKREIRRWTDDTSVAVLSGRTPESLKPYNDCTFFIINWDILYQWKDELTKKTFKAIIGDEFQAIGSPKALRTRAFISLARRIQYFIGLSGTPIRSRPAQFFSALNLVSPDTFPNRYKFYNRYCDPKFNGWGWEYKGASNTKELHQIVSPFMIRHRKKDVVKDMPAKTRTVIPLEITDRKEYDEQLDKLKNTKFEKMIDLRNQIEALKYSAFALKKDLILKWIEGFLEGRDKLVIYAYHRSVIEFLLENFKDISVKIDGGTNQKDRQLALKKFQQTRTTKLFIANILTVLGLDGLQKVCSDAIFTELIWTPTDILQAEDRLHRIGQEEPVNIYYLIATGTVEDDLVEILDEKMQMLDSVLNGKDTDETDLLSVLIKKYRTERIINDK